jgi:putative ABC transport system ATP-binding protein
MPGLAESPTHAARAGSRPGGTPLALVEAEDLRLSVGAGRFELQVESLRIEAGDRVALVGPSGSGKSTLLAGLCGLLPAASGSLKVLGVDLTRATDGERRALLRTRLAVLFQDLILFNYLSVAENALVPARLAESGELQQARRDLPAWLERLGLTARAQARPDQLSGGERQRAALLRALLLPRPLLLLDEPTSALDPELLERVQRLLLETAAARDAGLLLVTHEDSTTRLLGRCLQTVPEGPGRARLVEVKP